jgi:CRISP-associated protein Cas1
MDAQLASKLPMRKRLWQTLIKCKIAHQASLLEAWNFDSVGLKRLHGKVRSGDPENIEAQAARRYWSTLFGTGFKRDREADGANALLNYGYTVLRSATARFVVAAGLHPTVSLHHANQLNPMRLVDDLIEPFRPYVDGTVRTLVEQGKLDVNAETKRALAMLLYTDHETTRGISPLIQSIERLCVSLALVFLDERKALDLPEPPSKIDWQTMMHVGARHDVTVGVPDHVDDGDV